MSEKWKSLPKKYCEICKCWFGDNKPSIAHHESGKNHKDNVVKYLKEVRIRSAKKNEEEKLAKNFFSKIEETALKSYAKDIQSGIAKPDSKLKSNPAPKQSATFEKQTDYIVHTSDATEETHDTPTAIPIYKGGRKKQNSNLNSIPPAKKIKPDPGYFPPNPYGKWVPVEEPTEKESNINKKPKQEQQQQQEQEQPIESLQFTERTLDSLLPTQKDKNIEFHQPISFTAKKRNFRRATDDD